MISKTLDLSGQDFIANRWQLLRTNLLILSFLNFFLVASIGLMLRAFPLVSFPLNYIFLLHGHSHFAFGGWIFPILVWLIMKFFPEISVSIAWHHWRNLVALIFISAYGMLLTFPFQGYALMSIIFSTISVIAGFYLAWMIWPASSNQKSQVSVLFLRAGVIYMLLSSLGPFATGPLTVMGKTGTSLYADVIYFYLHFQYNGWFCFLILAVFMKILEKQGIAGHGKKVFLLLNFACLPSFFLSTLWHHPGLVFNMMGGFAGLMQLAAVYYLIKDVKNLSLENTFLSRLVKFILAILVLKLVLQFLSAFPVIADMAFQNRGFIIAYLHMVLLGFISLSGILFLISSETGLITHQMKSAILLFIFSFGSTELLLVLQPIAGWLKISIPFYPQILFFLSIFYPLSVLWIGIIIERGLTAGENENRSLRRAL